MKSKKKNYAGPVIAAGILLLYYIGLIVVFLAVPGILLWIKLLLCLIPAIVCALVIYVLVQRIREIRSGETDDLDRY
ncbi:MAG: hypothetical protein IJ334_10680 [Clostridia bacterium]|nr:hypothetical protein [Clostridia bacterium]